ncbi:hypothetical protein HHL16_07435 [Pseudoflavitalea sp. G-6-1-2]|uniref:FAD-dependent monooxygenase n=1 Tax=Pseudoflavitalea sp. G-6-1-2 TaxID=2728841 RepID=UPI00146C9EE7|nr:FAD-dependent monooxygenase [Pseudoflavitalea sp. G-6-1-2]NML20700.1 hypothetical protein [Pseudoflavitalea sp. G-6-1-2]
MEVAIIGAGIGGLTTALAFKQAGIPFKIYESAPELKPVGAGIIIANNAMQVFRYFGLAEKIAAGGNRISVMNITKPGLQPLSSGSLEYFEKKYHLSNVAIHRARLHHILTEAVGEEHIVLNKRLKQITRDNKNFQLTFIDGSTHVHEYIVGADGINSKVRKELFKEDELRNAGQLCWRGVTQFQLPQEHHHAVNEAWGKGKRFGFLRIDERTVYWYFLINNKYAESDTDILPLLHDFHPLASQIVRSTSKENLIVNTISDLKPISRWSMQNACLIGDAAHATTPNLGQGACQAIEDAYVIAQLLQKHSIGDTFNRYPELRMEKARYIVNASWKIGNLAHLESGIGISLRNLLLKAVPDRVNKKQLEKIFALSAVQ